MSSEHPIFPDKPAFVPEPGRIVLVRFADDPRPLPGIIVRSYEPGNMRIKVNVFTGVEGYENEVVDIDPAPDADSPGWFRPGQWPQPTLGG